MVSENLGNEVVRNRARAWRSRMLWKIKIRKPIGGSRISPASHDNLCPQRIRIP